MKKEAFKEAITDTIVAALINVPLNYLFINIAFYYNMTAAQTTLFFTIAFSIFAITRKYYTRVYFAKRNGV